MPFTSADRELLAAINERTKNLPCAEHANKISTGMAYGRASIWLLGLVVAGAGLLQGLHCYVR